MKRMIAMLLCTTMVLSCMLCVPVVSFAETEGEVLYYNDFSENADGMEPNYYTITDEEDKTVYGVKTLATGEDVFYLTGENVKTTYQCWAISTKRFEKTSNRDLVFEYRVKLSSMGYSSYFGYDHRLKGARSARYTSSNLTLHSGAATSTAADMKEWHTLTFVYSATEKKRNVYLDGTFIAESDEETVNEAYTSENPWCGDRGYFQHNFILQGLNNGTTKTEAYLDYVKIYEVPSSGSAMLESAASASASALFVHFDNQVDFNSLTASQFEIDGVAVQSVRALDRTGTSFELTPAQELEPTKSYTLSISEVSDIFGNRIDVDLPFTVSASITRDVVPEYFLDFKDQSELTQLDKLSNGGTKPAFNQKDAILTTADDDGSSVLKLTAGADAPDFGGAVGTGVVLPLVTNAEATRPDVVFEYRVKLNKWIGWNSLATAIFHTRNNGVWYPATDGAPSAQVQYSGTQGAPELAVGSTAAPYTNPTSFHTVAVRYNGANSDRTVYLDGQKVGETTNCTERNAEKWSKNGSLRLAFWVQYDSSQGANPSTAEIDYATVYIPNKFGAKIETPVQEGSDSFLLNFNAGVWNLQTSQITVNDKAIKSLTLEDRASQIYRVTMNETIQPGVEYKVGLKGIQNTYGETLTADLFFQIEEEPLSEYKVHFKAGENGSVEVNGSTQAKTFTVQEGDDLTFTAVPESGYRLADVYINGIPTIVNKDDTYTIRDIQQDTTVELSFENSNILPEIKASTYSFNDPQTGSSVNFATLINSNSNFELTKYGMIASRFSIAPTLLDVRNGTAFELESKIEPNVYGEYGIQIVDPDNTILSGSYWVRPYAWYGDRLIYAEDSILVDFTGTRATEGIDWNINETLLAANEGVHPRMFYTDDTFAFLKEKIKDTNSMEYKAWLSVLYRAEDAVEDDIFELETDETTYPYHEMGMRLPSLAVAYRLTGDEEFLNNGLLVVDKLLSYSKWGEDDQEDGDFNHLYSVGAFEGIALFYDWCYHSLSEEKRTEIATKLGERAKSHLDRAWYSEAYLQNHYSITLSAMMLAALAIYGEYEDARELLEEGVERLKPVYAFMPTDAGTYEGKEYHYWMFDQLLKIAVPLESMTGVSLFAHPSMENLMYTIMYNHWGMEKITWEWGQFSFGDTAVTERKFRAAPIVAYLAQRYNSPVGKWFTEEFLRKKRATATKKTSYTDDDWLLLFSSTDDYKSIQPKNYPGGYPLDRLLADTGYAYMRSDWNGQEDAIAYHCGPPTGLTAASYPQAPGIYRSYGSGHGHADNGHFQLYSNGETLFFDDGYTISSTNNHSTLLIDGVGQLGDADADKALGVDSTRQLYEENRPQIRKMVSTDAYCYVMSDVTEAYHPNAGLTKFYRHLIYHRAKKTLIVFDELATSKELADFSIRFRTSAYFEATGVFDEETNILTFSSKKNILQLKPLNQTDMVTYQNEMLYAGKSGYKGPDDIYAVHKHAKECTNAVAVTWNKLGSQVADVTMTQSGNLFTFNIGSDVTLVLDIANQTLTSGQSN